MAKTFEHQNDWKYQDRARITDKMAAPIDNRWKAILGMSSDHAGINRELGSLRTEMYRVLARIEDPRRVRDYIQQLRLRSRAWFNLEQDAPLEK